MGANQAKVQIGFRAPAEMHNWVRTVCFHERKPIGDWLVEAVEEKLSRSGAGALDDGGSPAARIFGQQMAKFYSEVEGTADEAFVDQMRSLADTVLRTRKLAVE